MKSLSAIILEITSLSQFCRSVAAVAGTPNNGFDNLVINSVALEKHAIDVVPNGDTAAAAADLQGRRLARKVELG